MSKIRSKISTLAGTLRQWVPLSKFLTITAILDEAGDFAATEPSAILGSVASYRKPVFNGSQAAVDGSAIASVFEELGNRSWDWSSFKMPSTTQFINSFNSAIDSAPSRNRIPYSGLRHNQIRQSTQFQRRRHNNPLSGH